MALTDERKGQAFLAGSFLLCPCHLPFTLTLLASLFGGTALAGGFHDHAWIAGTVLTITWLAGSAVGVRYIRKANRSCDISSE